MLFVGLDSGVADPEYETVARRRNALLDYFREKGSPWNGHFRGVIHTAAALLDIACVRDCWKNCARKEESQCALCAVSQTNVVKHVDANKSRMKFDAGGRVPASIGVLKEEIAALEPDIVVFHGKAFRAYERELESGNGFRPIRLAPAVIGVLRSLWGDDDDLIDDLNPRLQSDLKSHHIVFAFLRHPSNGWLERDIRSGLFEKEVAEIKSQLATISAEQ